MGGSITKETMIKKYGSVEGYRKFMSEIGKKGGSAEVAKGFAKMSKEKHMKASVKGGKVKR